MNAWQLLLTITASCLVVLLCAAVTIGRSETSTSLRHGVTLGRIRTVSTIVAYAAAYIAAASFVLGVWVGFAAGWSA